METEIKREKEEKKGGKGRSELKKNERTEGK